MSLSNIKVNNTTVISVDEKPTNGSNNIVRSSGINEQISKKVNNSDLFDGIINLFNKDAVVKDYYVDWNNGPVSADGSDSSGWIEIPEGTTQLYLSQVNTQYPGFAFKDSEGNIQKPVGSSTYRHDYGLIYVPSNAKYIIFTVYIGALSDTNDYENGMLTVGNSEPEEYVPYGIGIIKESLLPSYDTDVSQNKKFFIRKNGIIHDIRTSFNEDYDIVVTVRDNPNTNGIFNINHAKLITKESELDTDGLSLIGAGIDDASPTRLNNDYIGGNHGQNGAIVIHTSSAHNKTLADVGSIYVDSSNIKFYILKIINTTSLWVISENLSTLPDWSFKRNPSGTLTYDSNGFNTSSIVISNVVSGEQFYPSVKNKEQYLICDGIKILNDGEYYADKLILTETYDIIDSVDQVNKLVSNRPSGGYSSEPNYLNADSLVTISTQYNFQDQAKCTIGWSWIVNKKFKMFEFFGTQYGYHKPDWITDWKRCVPHLLPFSDGSKNWDLRVPTSIFTDSDKLNSGKTVLSDDFEDGKRPLRLFDTIYSPTLHINFNLGILPVAHMTNIDNYTNAAWYFRSYPTSTYSSFWKAYPKVIDSKINAADGFVEPGTSIQGVMYRGWSHKTNMQSNYFSFYNGDDYYVICDFHVVVEYRIPIPEHLCGKQITIIEKSDNVLLYDTYATSMLRVGFYNATSPFRAYLMIKI